MTALVLDVAPTRCSSCLNRLYFMLWGFMNILLENNLMPTSQEYIFVLFDPDLHLFTAVHIEVIGAKNLTLKIEQVEIYLPLFIWYSK